MIICQGPDHLIFIHGPMKAEWHQHHFIQIGLGQFQLATQTQETKAQSGFILNSQVAHKVNATGEQNATVLIDNNSDFGLFLQKNILKGADCQQLTIPSTIIHSPTWLIKLVRYLGYKPKTLKQDGRVARVIEMLHQNPNVSLSKLSESLHLSTSRLSHLFKAQMQVSFRSYQRHIKILTAVKHLRSAKNLTQVAQDAGFNDSAHLSNTIKHYFGTSPKLALAATEFIEEWRSVGQLLHESTANG